MSDSIPKTQAAGVGMAQPQAERVTPVVNRYTQQHFFAFEIGFDPASPAATPR